MLSSPRSPLHLLLACSLVGLLSMGVVLRWALAGHVAFDFNFAHLRAAHSHLAWYGVVFPLCWVSLARRGRVLVGPTLAGLYSLAVAASVWGFATQGYAPLSIVGSTVVLGVWWVAMAPLALRFFQRDLLASVFPSVLASSLAIPAVAVLARRGDPASVDWVHAFLTWLMLGVALPVSLLEMKAKPLYGPLWTALVIGAGLALGPMPTLMPRLALAGVGVYLVLSARNAALRGVYRGFLVLFGLGLMARAVGVLPDVPAVAIAGVHFAALGPVLFPLAWPEGGRKFEAVYAAALSVFVGSIAAPVWWPHPTWAWLAAASGSALAVAWMVVLVRGLSMDGFLSVRIPKEIL